jgi:hypothetical protein
VKRSLVPELVIAALALVAAAGGAYALSGAPGAVVAVVAFAALALVVTAWLLPLSPAPPQTREQLDENRRPTTWFHNYWRQRERVEAGTKSMASYRSSLGPQLQNLLAARLGETHGINLYTDPEAARRLFCARPRDQELWPWVAPARPGPPEDNAGEPEPSASKGKEAPGIPPAVLARLVQRLENL